jgi:hypothetical protein
MIFSTGTGGGAVEISDVLLSLCATGGATSLLGVAEGGATVPTGGGVSGPCCCAASGSTSIPAANTIAASFAITTTRFKIRPQ